MERAKGIVDISKPITQLPECGVEGCSNDGWIGLGSRFVCGECLLKYQKIKNEEIFEKLKNG
mgnify:CR=1 FL=1